MAKYCVTIVRHGALFVEADSALEAMNIADRQLTSAVSWSDDWSPTDAEEDDSYIGEYISEPAF